MCNSNHREQVQVGEHTYGDITRLNTPCMFPVFNNTHPPTRMGESSSVNDGRASSVAKKAGSILRGATSRTHLKGGRCGVRGECMCVGRKCIKPAPMCNPDRFLMQSMRTGGILHPSAAGPHPGNIH